MAFLGLSSNERRNLEFEVISQRARLQLTRLLREVTDSGDQNVQILKQNRVINIAHAVLGLPTYVLESDGWGDYEVAEHAWHNGEIELVSRRPNTVALVETLADLIQNDVLRTNSVNEILSGEGVPIQFTLESGSVEVYISGVDEIEEDNEEEHPNIRLLIQRMESALERGDYSAVLHSSACVFETLAKDVVSDAAVNDRTLAQFFERYRNRSALPENLLDFMLAVYRRRNREPLAGHGNVVPSTIQQDEAILLVEMTKAFVRIERQLQVSSTPLTRPPTATAPSGAPPAPPVQPSSGASIAVPQPAEIFTPPTALLESQLTSNEETSHKSS